MKENKTVVQRDFVIIIQARTGSTRLPKKMVMDFLHDQTIPEVIVARLKLAFPEIITVLATTSSQLDNDLAAKMEGKVDLVYRGDEEDVLERFLDVKEIVQAKAVIRVCADNPFLDMSLLQELIQDWEDGMDYLAHRIEDKPSMKTAFGFFAEITTYEALEKVKSMTQESLYHEHVTNFVYENPNDFNVNWLPVEKSISDNQDIRLTVDTENDFENAKKVFEYIQENRLPVSYQEVIEYVKKNNFTETMKKENKANEK